MAVERVSFSVNSGKQRVCWRLLTKYPEFCRFLAKWIRNKTGRASRRRASISWLFLSSLSWWNNALLYKRPGAWLKVATLVFPEIQREVVLLASYSILSIEMNIHYCYYQTQRNTTATFSVRNSTVCPFLTFLCFRNSIASCAAAELWLEVSIDVIKCNVVKFGVTEVDQFSQPTKLLNFI